MSESVIRAVESSHLLTESNDTSACRFQRGMYNARFYDMLHSRRCEDDDASKVLFERIIDLIVIGGHFSSSRGRYMGQNPIIYL